MHYHWDLAMVLADTDRWWQGIGITLLYSVATVAGGIVIGVFCGLALLSQKRWLTLPLEGYVEIFRCTPLLIQIVWFYYALPILLNFSLPAWLAAGLGLTLYMGAFCTEIFRAGVMSIGRGQWQAGRALGMTYTDLRKFSDTGVPWVLGRMACPYGAGEAGIQATAQSERISPWLVANWFQAISQAFMMSARLANSELASQWLRR